MAELTEANAEGLTARNEANYPTVSGQHSKDSVRAHIDSSGTHAGKVNDIIYPGA